MSRLYHFGRILFVGILIILVTSACGLRNAPGLEGGVSPEASATPTAVSELAQVSTVSPTLQPPPPTATRAAPATPRPLPTATAVPTATPTETATTPPTATVPPTAIPLPTDTPTPVPTATLEVPLPDWLAYLNRFRAMAYLPPVTDWEDYTQGSRLHSEYMAVNDEAIAHSEDKANALYTDAGDRAARNGNIFATSQTDANYVWSINFWASAPFHMIAMLDPKLGHVGYGDAVEPKGDVQMAAVLDVGSDPGQPTDTILFPVIYPGPNSETWVVRHSLYEWPDPLASCPGYSRPSGAAIILMLGTGNVTPHVDNHRLALGDEVLDTCIFDETNYTNPDSYAQKIGRQILDLSDAIVIMPRYPLAADETYTAQVTANGQTYTWQFKTKKRPD